MTRELYIPTANRMNNTTSPPMTRRAIQKAPMVVHLVGGEGTVVRCGPFSPRQRTRSMTYSPPKDFDLGVLLMLGIETGHAQLMLNWDAIDVLLCCTS